MLRHARWASSLVWIALFLSHRLQPFLLLRGIFSHPGGHPFGWHGALFAGPCVPFGMLGGRMYAGKAAPGDLSSVLPELLAAWAKRHGLCRACLLGGRTAIVQNEQVVWKRPALATGPIPTRRGDECGPSSARSQ